MKKGIIITLAVAGLAAAGIYIFLAGKRDTIISTIPQNSIIVSKVSVLDIGRKLDMEQIKNSKLLQLLKEESDGKADQMFGGTSGGMGVDFLAPVYLYVYTRADDRRADDPMVGISFGISDEEDFRKALQSAGLMDNPPPPSSDFNYIRPDGDALLAWKDDLAIFLACDGCRDNTFISEASRLFKQSEEASIKSNAEFSSFNSESADINLFLNKPELQRFLGRQTQILQTKSARDAFATIPTGLTLLFEDDAIILQSYPGSDSDGGIEAFQSAGLSDSDLELVSNEAPLGFMSINLDMDEIVNTIRESENAELELAEESLRNMGLSLEDLARMIKGNMSLALTSFPANENNEYGSTIPIYSFHMGIADVPTFERLMDNFSLLEKDDNLWIFPPDGNGKPLGYMLLTNGELVITNDDVAFGKFREGKKWPAISNDMGGSDAGNNPVCVFIDYTRMQGLIEEAYRLPGVSRNDAELLSTVMADMNSFALTGDNQQFRMELKFKATNTNAIMHIFSMAERLALSQMSSKEESAEEYWSNPQEIVADTVYAVN